MLDVGEDIEPGMQWSQAVFDALSRTNIGIICVTHCNQRSPWLNFEAGAVAKAVTANRVIPYLLDLSPGEVTGPLQQFQAVRADEEGTRRMCRSINEQLDRPLTETQISRVLHELLAGTENALEQPAGSIGGARPRARFRSRLAIPENT